MGHLDNLEYINALLNIFRIHINICVLLFLFFFKLKMLNLNLFYLISLWIVFVLFWIPNIFFPRNRKSLFFRNVHASYSCCLINLIKHCWWMVVSRDFLVHLKIVAAKSRRRYKEICMCNCLFLMNKCEFGTYTYAKISLTQLGCQTVLKKRVSNHIQSSMISLEISYWITEWDRFWFIQDLF